MAALGARGWATLLARLRPLWVLPVRRALAADASGTQRDPGTPLEHSRLPWPRGSAAPRGDGCGWLRSPSGGMRVGAGAGPRRARRGGRSREGRG